MSESANRDGHRPGEAWQGSRVILGFSAVPAGTHEVRVTWRKGDADGFSLPLVGWFFVRTQTTGKPVAIPAVWQTDLALLPVATPLDEAVAQKRYGARWGDYTFEIAPAGPATESLGNLKDTLDELTASVNELREQLANRPH